jgi:hypothetical protein
MPKNNQSQLDFNSKPVKIAIVVIILVLIAIIGVLYRQQSDAAIIQNLR